MLVLTASAVTTRPHGLHSNVCIGGKSAWATVRANRIVSPQHGQATYSLYSRIRLSPIHEAAGPVGTELPHCCTVGRFWPISGKPGSHHSTCLTAVVATGSRRTLSGMLDARSSRLSPQRAGSDNRPAHILNQIEHKPVDDVQCAFSF
jgi:hypothetical protein